LPEFKLPTPTLLREAGPPYASVPDLLPGAFFPLDIIAPYAYLLDTLGRLKSPPPFPSAYGAMPPLEPPLDPMLP